MTNNKKISNSYSFVKHKSFKLLLLFFILHVSMPYSFLTRRTCFKKSQTNTCKQKIILLSSKDSSSNLVERKDLWKTISSLEKEAVNLLSSGDDNKKTEAFKVLSNSLMLKNSDPFLKLATSYAEALKQNNNMECERILQEMKIVGPPPHLSNLAKQKEKNSYFSHDFSIEEVDPGTTFSDTITEKIRVKVSSFYDYEKSDPINGKYMFWYKVAIYNEGPEPVQVVARMWEIEKCRGEKEIVRGAGIMSTQPIIPPGEVYTYQSVCPLKVFPPKGKRVIGSMSGAYTMCKGNMGQHNFTVKVGKFNLIIPDSIDSTSS